jgi:hypothetical protein
MDSFITFSVSQKIDHASMDYSHAHIFSLLIFLPEATRSCFGYEVSGEKARHLYRLAHALGAHVASLGSASIIGWLSSHHLSYRSSVCSPLELHHTLHQCPIF